MMVSATIGILSMVASMNEPDIQSGPVVSTGVLTHNEQGGRNPWTFHNEQGSTLVEPGTSAGDLLATFAFTPGTGDGLINAFASYSVVFVYEYTLTTADPLPYQQGIVRFQGLVAHNEQGDITLPVGYFDAFQPNPTGPETRTYTVPAGEMQGVTIIGGLDVYISGVDPLCDTTTKIVTSVRCEATRVQP